MKTVQIEIKIPDNHEVVDVSYTWPGWTHNFAGETIGEMTVRTRPQPDKQEQFNPIDGVSSACGVVDIGTDR